MKKVIALLLLAVMAFSFAACADGTAKESASPAPSQSAAPVTSTEPSPAESKAPEASPAASEPAEIADVGYMEDCLAYVGQRDKYKLCFLSAGKSAITSNFFNAMAELSEPLNFEIELVCCDGDYDLFINSIETLYLSGTQGFVYSAPDDVRARTVEISYESNIPFTLQGMPYFDEEGHSLAPCAQVDNAFCGSEMINYLNENYKSYWGDGATLTKDNFRCVAVTYSATAAFTECHEATKAEFLKQFPEWSDSLVVVDTVDAGQTNQAGYEKLAAIFAAYPGVEYWWVCCVSEDHAQGIARAAEEMGIDDKTLILSKGDATITKEWDSGYDGCWVASISTPPIAVTSRMITGVVTLLDGRATYETLWASKKKEGDFAAINKVECFVITKENYKDIQRIAYESLGLTYTPAE